MIHMLHVDFPHIGGWTIIPLIDQLISLHQSNSSWIFFLQDNTHVTLEKLMNTFDKYNENDVSIILIFITFGSFVQFPCFISLLSVLSSSLY